MHARKRHKCCKSTIFSGKKCRAMDECSPISDTQTFLIDIKHSSNQDNQVRILPPFKSPGQDKVRVTCISLKTTCIMSSFTELKNSFLLYFTTVIYNKTY